MLVRKRKTKEAVGPQLSSQGKHLTGDAKKAKLLKSFCLSIHKHFFKNPQTKLQPDS